MAWKAIDSSFARASVGVEENNAIGDALPNLDTTKQSLIQEIGQKSQTPTTLQNQPENYINTQKDEKIG